MIFEEKRTFSSGLTLKSDTLVNCVIVLSDNTKLDAKSVYIVLSHSYLMEDYKLDQGYDNLEKGLRLAVSPSNEDDISKG